MAKAIDYVDGFALDNLKSSKFADVELVEPNFLEYSQWQNTALRMRDTGKVDAADVWYGVDAVARNADGSKVFASRDDFNSEKALVANALAIAANNYLFEYTVGVEATEKKGQAATNDISTTSN